MHVYIAHLKSEVKRLYQMAQFNTLMIRVLDLLLDL